MELYTEDYIKSLFAILTENIEDLRKAAMYTKNQLAEDMVSQLEIDLEEVKKEMI